MVRAVGEVGGGGAAAAVRVAAATLVAAVRTTTGRIHRRRGGAAVGDTAPTILRRRRCRCGGAAFLPAPIVPLLGPCRRLPCRDGAAVAAVPRSPLKRWCICRGAAAFVAMASVPLSPPQNRRSSTVDTAATVQLEQLQRYDRPHIHRRHGLAAVVADRGAAPVPLLSPPRRHRSNGVVLGSVRP